MTLQSLHSKSISTLLLSESLGMLFTGSLDTTIKVTGLTSGILLKELKGHSSFVHKLLVVEQQTQLLSAGADGQIIVRMHVKFK